MVEIKDKSCFPKNLPIKRLLGGLQLIFYPYQEELIDYCHPENVLG
jgi:hypothetical protein